MGNEMSTSGQMGAPAPTAQRQADTTTLKKPATQAGAQAGAQDSRSAQQGGETGSSQFTDWASI
ncbi:MAG: hypothetical protein ACOY4T_05540 [Pseudomonadota bacterium]